MTTTFKQLNDGWNAEPNGPEPKTKWLGNDLCLSFYVNSFQFPEYKEGDVGKIIFTDCSRYRLGTLNDEGWYRGQCRFSGIKHQCGGFYQVEGDLRLGLVPGKWETRDPEIGDRLHFLFYFRDEDFECDARGWQLKIIRAEQPASADIR